MNEVRWDTDESVTLYFIRWTEAGLAIKADGLSSVIYTGEAGFDFSDFAIPMPEKGGGSGHYIGHFDELGNIEDGRYDVTVYKKLGSIEDNSDTRLARGTIVWVDGAEVVVTSGGMTLNHDTDQYIRSNTEDTPVSDQTQDTTVNPVARTSDAELTDSLDEESGSEASDVVVQESDIEVED